MRTTSALFILMIAGFAAACSQSAHDHGLAAARDRWAMHAPSTYRFTWTRACECPPEMTRPIQVDVASGQITGAVYVDDRTPVAEKFRSSLRTVEGVFADIQAAIDQSADEIDVDFDPALGYPRSVFVDYSRQIADEELAIQIASFDSTIAN